MEGIVIFSGKICSGKSSQAKLLTETDPNWVRVPLAKALKQKVARACELTDNQLEQPGIKAVVRPLLQFYGTDVMRKLHGNDYWVKHVLLSAEAQNHRYLVVDDVRFPNELRFLKMYALVKGIPFVAVRLNFDRGIPDHQERRYLSTYGKELTPAVTEHISETALDDWWDWDVFQNTATPPWVLSTVLLDYLRRAGFEHKNMVIPVLSPPDYRQYEDRKPWDDECCPACGRYPDETGGHCGT